MIRDLWPLALIAIAFSQLATVEGFGSSSYYPDFGSSSYYAPPIIPSSSYYAPPIIPSSSYYAPPAIPSSSYYAPRPIPSSSYLVGPTPAPHPNPNPQPHPNPNPRPTPSSDGLSTGTQIGIGVGAGALFIGAVIGLLMYRKRRKRAGYSVPELSRDDAFASGNNRTEGFQNPHQSYTYGSPSWQKEPTRGSDPIELYNFNEGNQQAWSSPKSPPSPAPPRYTSTDNLAISREVERSELPTGWTSWQQSQATRTSYPPPGQFSSRTVGY